MRLVVFFSRGMSLEGWRRAGILHRELALYRALRPSVDHIAFLTYGGTRELALASQLPGVEILPNRWRLATKSDHRKPQRTTSFLRNRRLAMTAHQAPLS